MRLARYLFGISALFSLAGCIDVETVVRVRPDGSGAVEERMLMSEELANLTAQMQSMGGDKAEGAPQLFKREQLEARTAGMGPGVSLLSVEPLTVGKRQGYKAVFAFQDVNTLRLNQNPSDKAPSGPGMGGQGSEQKEEPLTFAFKPGPTPELVIRSAAKQPDEAGQETAPAEAPRSGGPQDEAGAEMAMAMMKEMFKDLRIMVAVEVEGQIVETNASFQEGSRVTMMELDFGKLLENADKFKEFAERNPQSLADAKALMKDLPGIKAELSPEVRIRFTAAGETPRQHLASTSPASAQPPAAGDYQWRTVALAQAGQHERELVEVTELGGTAHKGLLREVSRTSLTLRKAAMDGGAVVTIPLKRVRQLQVFDRGL